MQLRQLLSDGERDTRIMLLGAGVLLVLAMNYASRAFAARVIGLPPGAPECVLWHYGGTLLFFGVAPVMLWRLVLRRPLAEIGLCVGDARFAVKLLATMVPVLIVIAWISSHDPEIRTEYPLANVTGDDVGQLALLEAAYLLYYVGWEVFFRGWLVLALAPRIGALHAVALSTLVSTAVHYGKPGGEVWAALIAGVLLGWFVLRTRSIIGAIVFHAVVGIATDLFVTFGPGNLR